MLRPFTSLIQTYSPRVPDPILARAEVMRANSMEELFSTSDVVVELAAATPENYHIVTVHLASDGAQQTRVSLHQDNNLTDEARERAERNWSLMLGGLRHFVEHNRAPTDTEPD